MLVVLLLVVFVAKFLWLLLAFAVAAVTGRLLGRWLAHRDDRLQARRLRDAATAARADQQYQWARAGDDRGTFGDYPPAVPS